MTHENFDCEICYEEFDETGPHVPLVLPCGHTLCAQCVGSLQSHTCPTCKHPLYTLEGAAESATVVFPRNIWLIRCLLASKTTGKTSQKVLGSKKGAPVVAVEGQRVMFKRLHRACASVSSETSTDSVRLSADSLLHQRQSEKRQEGKQQERLFLLQLSRICKEKKAQDPTFDQKRFVKEGLVMKFGDAKAKVIMQQVYSRIQCMRKS